MKRLNLSVKFALFFSTVTLVIAVIVTLILRSAMNEIRVSQDRQQQSVYLEYLTNNYFKDDLVHNEYNGYLIFYQNGEIVSNKFDMISHLYSIQALETKFYRVFGLNDISALDEDNIFFMGKRVDNILILTFSNGQYQLNAVDDISDVVVIVFISVIIFGNLIILIWSSRYVRKILNLTKQVNALSTTNYVTKITTTGLDEIADLSRSIEKMREEIYHNDQVKQEMIQNVSHDFKTPIAVIQSYAESMKDGISGIESADVIIKQADILNQKVKQLLEFNKLEYLKSHEPFQTIHIKEVIITIVKTYKYQTQCSFELDLDDSTYEGIMDSFYILVHNILDNAVRYAKTKIVITLQNKRLTFFNDGEPVSEKFINKPFKPYEKGEKGQFGLGMTIVQKVVDHFQLKLIVKNEINGVAFTIEPI